MPSRRRAFMGLAGLAMAACLAVAAAGTRLAAGEPSVAVHVASRSFLVSVAPVDQASENAESARLYRRSAGEAEWTEDGPCRREVLADGAVRFSRETGVAADGVYHFTSRPVVGGGVAFPPSVSSPPQAVVVVDLSPPLAEIVKPGPETSIAPGEAVGIAWSARDENLPPLPAALSYSADGGRSWIAIKSDLPAEGEETWTAPENLAGPADIRLAVSDLAGNIGRDLRRLGLAAVRTGTPAKENAEHYPDLTEPAPDKPARAATPTPDDDRAGPDSGRSWLYYLMAVNLMRQDKPADALQYYWLAAREDPDFIEPWADMGLAYIDLGAYKTARETLSLARDRAPERAGLMHLMGEAYHAEGMELLVSAATPEKRLAAKGLIDQAAEWYGRALAKAEEDWSLSEQAASFYRLGEICYYVNLDGEGARAYWEKILRLHAPDPNLDLVLWTPEERRDKARTRLQHDTHRRAALEVWQNWARGYLEQLDARRRAGMADFLPARRIPSSARPTPLSYGQNAINPGRDDGRSLFSLPAQPGSPSGSPAMPVASAVAGPSRRIGGPAADYSPYARKNSDSAGLSAYGRGKTSAGMGRGSVFSGGPDAPPPPNPDPYAFPARTRQPAAWNGAGPYGNIPERE